MVRSKRFFMKFYLVLIIAFLYIPIAVLVVLSFNNSRSRVVSQQRRGGGAAEYIDHRIWLGSHRNHHRRACCSGYRRDEKEKLFPDFGSGQYPYAQRGYRNGYRADAVVFQIHQSGLCEHSAGSCDL